MKAIIKFQRKDGLQDHLTCIIAKPDDVSDAVAWVERDPGIARVTAWVIEPED